VEAGNRTEAGEAVWKEGVEAGNLS
jgi:hypothetical protein